MAFNFDPSHEARWSLGNKIQRQAIACNNSQKHTCLGPLGGRSFAVLLKPCARIVDAALQVFISIGIVIVTVGRSTGYVAKAIFCVIRCKRPGPFSPSERWSFKQGVYHLGYGAIYFLDIFVAVPANVLSPNLYPAYLSQKNEALASEKGLLERSLQESKDVQQRIMQEKTDERLEAEHKLQQLEAEKSTLLQRAEDEKSQLMKENSLLKSQVSELEVRLSVQSDITTSPGIDQKASLFHENKDASSPTSIPVAPPLPVFSAKLVKPLKIQRKEREKQKYIWKISPFPGDDTRLLGFKLEAKRQLDKASDIYGKMKALEEKINSKNNYSDDLTYFARKLQLARVIFFKNHFENQQEVKNIRSLLFNSQQIDDSMVASGNWSDDEVVDDDPVPGSQGVEESVILGESVLMVTPKSGKMRTNEEKKAILEDYYATRLLRVSETVAYLSACFKGTSEKSLQSKSQLSEYENQQEVVCRKNAAIKTMREIVRAREGSVAETVAKKILWRCLNMAGKTELVTNVAPGSSVDKFNIDRYEIKVLTSKIAGPARIAYERELLESADFFAYKRFLADVDGIDPVIYEKQKVEALGIAKRLLLSLGFHEEIDHGKSLEQLLEKCSLEQKHTYHYSLKGCHEFGPYMDLFFDEVGGQEAHLEEEYLENEKR